MLRNLADAVEQGEPLPVELEGAVADEMEDRLDHGAVRAARKEKGRATLEDVKSDLARRKKAQRARAAYPLDLRRVRSTEQLLANVTYWFSLFSHRRDGRWKGLLAVGLDADDDARARLRLEALP